MLAHLKSWWPAHAIWICGVVAFIAQFTSRYLTGHPKATASELFGALGFALITFLMKSPTQGDQK